MHTNTHTHILTQWKHIDITCIMRPNSPIHTLVREIKLLQQMRIHIHVERLEFQIDIVLLRSKHGQNSGFDQIRINIHKQNTSTKATEMKKKRVLQTTE